MSKLGHYSMEIIAAVLCLAVTSLWLPLPIAGSVSLAVVLIPALLVAWVAMRRHDRGFCDPCSNMIMEDTGQISADRNYRALKMVHLPQVVTAAYIFALITASVLMIGKPSTGMGIAWTALMLTLAYVLRANVVHHRLQPWCPTCKERGLGKDRMTVPTHDPVTA